MLVMITMIMLVVIVEIIVIVMVIKNYPREGPNQMQLRVSQGVRDEGVGPTRVGDEGGGRPALNFEPMWLITGPGQSRWRSPHTNAATWAFGELPMGNETCEGCVEMGGVPMVGQPLGPSVSSLWATKRVRGVPR